MLHAITYYVYYMTMVVNGGYPAIERQKPDMLQMLAARAKTEGRLILLNTSGAAMMVAVGAIQCLDWI